MAETARFWFAFCLNESLVDDDENNRRRFFSVLFSLFFLTGGLDDKNRDLFSKRALFFQKKIAFDSWKKRFFEKSEKWLKITWNFYRCNFLLVRVFFLALRFAVHSESKKSDESDLDWIYSVRRLLACRWLNVAASSERSRAFLSKTCRR